MTFLSNIVRSGGDPKVLHSGPSSLGTADQLAKALGWFSLGLGVVEVLVPGRITRMLGMEGKEGVVRAFGGREIGHALLTLSPDKKVGLWSRVAGDGLDIGMLMGSLRKDNPKRENVVAAIAMVMGVTLLDVIAAQSTSVRHSRNRGEQRLYPDRSGFPRGVQAARGAARDFTTPPDMRSAPVLADEVSPSAAA